MSMQARAEAPELRTLCAMTNARWRTLHVRPRRLDVVVVGGGIIGLATTYRLLEARPDLRIAIVEKESELASHQSGHNSGVLHAGLYYAPGSLKARLAVAGIREMTAFCQEHGIAHEVCGKL